MPRIVAARIDRKFWTELNFGNKFYSLTFNELEQSTESNLFTSFNSIDIHKPQLCTSSKHTQIICATFLLLKKKFLQLR